MAISNYRTGLRGFLEWPIFSPLRRHIMLQEALAEDRFVKEAAKNHAMPSFNLEKMKDRLKEKRKKVFYILGSGSSVEDLSRADFDIISGGVSVGVNAWALHYFVPDIYAFEPVPDRGSDHYSTMRLLDRKDVLSREPTIMFLKPRTPVEQEQLKMIPNGLRQAAMLYGRFQPYTRQSRNLSGDLQMAHFVKMMNLSVLPDSGASIFRMAFMGILLGYPRVVLVGVDLNNVDYFWQKNPAHLVRNGLVQFESGQLGRTHETLSNKTRAFGIVDSMSNLAEFARSLGTSLEVASSRSLLAKFLPVYDWTNMPNAQD